MSIDYSLFAIPKPAKKEKNKKIYIRNKSKKLSKKERKRFSILQQDKDKCFLCNAYCKTDTHEAFGGCNRQKSMEYGLIYYLCRICHGKVDLDKNAKQELHDIAKQKFIEIYGEEKFLQEFKSNYLEKI